MKKIAVAAILLFAVFATNTFGQTTAEELVKKGGEYFDKGDYANAITAYSESIKLDSTNSYAYWGRGDCYLNTGNYNAAIADYSKVITDMPYTARIYIDFDSDKIIKDEPIAYVYINRGRAYIGTKNYDAAIADFNKAFSLNSDSLNPIDYIFRGIAYGAKGLYHKAIADFKTGLEKGFDPSGFTVDKTNKADMWFCGAMYMEIIVNRFLGKNDVVTKYENWLKTVSDKDKVTRQEIEAFYRDNIRSLISDVMDEEFNKFSFPLRNLSADRTYNSVLSRNYKTGEYVLSYERPENKNSRKELSAQTLNALLVAMRNKKTDNKPDFVQFDLDTVRTQAALIPAAVLSNTALNEVKDILTNFYINPNAGTYTCVKETHIVLSNAIISTKNIRYGDVYHAYERVIYAFNEGLVQKVIDDVRVSSTVTTLTREQQRRLVESR
ncbi:tetratricopeptide repeat protein [Treponema sp. R80B11-R83G3]